MIFFLSMFTLKKKEKCKEKYEEKINDEIKKMWKKKINIEREKKINSSLSLRGNRKQAEPRLLTPELTKFGHVIILPAPSVILLYLFYLNFFV